MTYALDTNIIIHLLHNTPAVVMQYNRHVAHVESIVIPPFADYEIRRNFRYLNATTKELKYRRLCDICKIGEMRRDTWVRAANLYSELRRKGFTVGDGDILIAAFCVVNNCTLVTNNTKDFINIDGLKLVDWVNQKTQT